MEPDSIVQPVACLTADPVVTSSNPSSPTTFVDIDYEIISVVSLPLLLIQKGQLSVSGKRMCTSAG